LGVVNRPEAQLVLVDTPGLHESTRRVMNQYMNRVAISSSQDADVILFVIEAMRFTEEDEWVWERVRGLKQPLFLVHQQGRPGLPQGASCCPSSRR
jgi:GTP-binding protein Era